MSGKVKTRKQMAREYEVTEKTFRVWLKREGIILPKGLISPKNQKMIYETLGVPDTTI